MNACMYQPMAISIPIPIRNHTLYVFLRVCMLESKHFYTMLPIKGAYGMALTSDLNPASPTLQPTLDKSSVNRLQTRNYEGFFLCNWVILFSGQ